MMTTKGPDEPLVTALEAALKKVLSEDTLTLPDRIKVIEAGTKLLAVKHKMEPPDDGPGSFYRKPKT